MTDWYPAEYYIPPPSAPTRTKEQARRYNFQAGARRKSAIAMLKLETGCADCGYNADPAALEFDHVRGVKAGKNPNVIGSWRRFFEEIEKCDVVCANCHAIRTRDRWYS